MSSTKKVRAHTMKHRHAWTKCAIREKRYPRMKRERKCVSVSAFVREREVSAHPDTSSLVIVTVVFVFLVTRRVIVTK